jgi:hypothetical protein
VRYWLFKDKWKDEEGKEHGKQQCAVCGIKIVAAARFDEDSGKACCDKPGCTGKWDMEVMKRDDPDAYAKKQQELAEIEEDAKRLKEKLGLKAIEDDAEEVRRRNKL